MLDQGRFLLHYSLKIYVGGSLLARWLIPRKSEFVCFIFPPLMCCSLIMALKCFSHFSNFQAFYFTILSSESLTIVMIFHHLGHLWKRQATPTLGSCYHTAVVNEAQMLLKCNIRVLGYWYGIELERPHGKNDGSVGGVQYFSCSPRYGIFAPPSRVQRWGETRMGLYLQKLCNPLWHTGTLIPSGW